MHFLFFVLLGYAENICSAWFFWTCTFTIVCWIGCWMCFQSFEVCHEFFIDLLFKTSSNVFATSKDLIDVEHMEWSGCRLVHGLCYLFSVFVNKPFNNFMPFCFILVNVKIASCVLEFWFRWHQSLWTCIPECIKVWIDVNFYWHFFILFYLPYYPFMISLLTCRIFQTWMVWIQLTTLYPIPLLNLSTPQLCCRSRKFLFSTKTPYYLFNSCCTSSLFYSL